MPIIQILNSKKQLNDWTLSKCTNEAIHGGFVGHALLINPRPQIWNLVMNLHYKIMWFFSHKN
jgi:hypothetical protein